MNIENELARLDHLRRAGKMSEEEYETARKKILGEDKSNTTELQDSNETPREVYNPNHTNMASNLPGGLTEKTYLALMNFLILAPSVGWLAPIIIWIICRESSTKIDQQGKNIFNWMITMLIFTMVTAALFFIAFWVVIPLAVIGVLFPILGGLKGVDGHCWEYPLTYKFIK